MLSLGIFGTGRLGSAIQGAADCREDVTVRWALGREQEIPTENPVDVAIDVSHADALPDRLAWAARTGTPLVIGTTGYDPAVLTEYHAGQSTPVLLAPNFSLSVAILRHLVRLLGGHIADSPVAVDLAVTETHHRNKVDAPSGTALALAQALAQGAERPMEQIQMTSLRMGSVIGEHEVTLTSALETITVGHRAHDRALFATGALSAAHWLATRPDIPGILTLDDLVAEHLRNLSKEDPS